MPNLSIVCQSALDLIRLSPKAQFPAIRYFCRLPTLALLVGRHDEQRGERETGQY